MNKRFRMISLTAEALSLELEDIIDRDKIYESEFRKDFAEEIQYLMTKKDQRKEANEVIHPSEHKEEKTTEAPAKVFKELYRSLAKTTHPDLAGPEAEDEFKQIQAAYEELDLVTLLEAANRNNISPTLDDLDLEALQTLLESQRKKIKNYKETIRWIWGTSNKNLRLRNTIINSLGINPVDFFAWKAREKMDYLEKVRKQKAENKRKKLEAIEAQRRKAEQRKKRIRETQTGVRNPTRLRDLKKAAKKK